MWCGMAHAFFARGLLGSMCIVSGRIFACWLAVARIPFRVVDMARCVPSRHAKSSSKMVHVAWNGACSLIEDCSAPRVSFLAGFLRAGWLWLACHFVWSIWRAVSPHGTPRARPKWCTWRRITSFLCFVLHYLSLYLSISLPLSTSLSFSLEHDAHVAACTPPSSLTPCCALLSADATTH